MKTSELTENTKPIYWNHKYKDSQIHFHEHGNTYIGAEAHRIMLELQRGLDEAGVPGYTEFNSALRDYLIKSPIWEQKESDQ